MKSIFAGLRVVTCVMTGLAAFDRSVVANDNPSAVPERLASVVAACQIDQPWDDLPGQNELIVKHRGLVSHLWRRLMSADPKIRKAFYDAFDAELRDQPSDRTPLAELRTSINPITWSELLDAAAAIIEGKDYLAARRGAFASAFYSTADGSGQPIYILLPKDYDPGTEYPLLVALAGDMPIRLLDDTREQPFITVCVSGRGALGMKGLALADTISLMDWMERCYRIDNSRVSIIGWSSGASSAMHIAATHPDKFAAAIPFVAFGNHATFENLRHVAVLCHHGQRDWVSAICCVRMQIKQMQDRGYPTRLVEYADLGHEIPETDATFEWMLAQRRPAHPDTVTLVAEAVTQAKAYWLEVLALSDAHKAGLVEAKLRRSEDRKNVLLQLDNVQTIALDLAQAGIEPTGPIVIDVNGQSLPANPVGPKIVIEKTDSRWVIASNTLGKPARHAYAAGAAANLYMGDPMMIVYGTAGGKDRTELLEKAARRLALFGGTYYAQMRYGKFPVKADTQVTESDIANCNLVLIGTPADNKLLQRMWPKLPVIIDDAKQLTITGRKPVSVEPGVVTLHYTNPLASGRLIYVLSAYGTDEQLANWSEQIEKFMHGGDGQWRFSQPDLAVQTFDGIQKLNAQLDSNWQWRIEPHTDKMLSSAVANRDGLAKVYLRIMQRESGGDYALWWGPADRGFYGYDFNPLPNFDPGTATFADLATKRTPIDTMMGQVPGAELKEIYEKWIANGQITVVPALDPASISDDHIYSLCIPPDLVYKLGKRRKLLANPRVGPTVRIDQLLPNATSLPTGLQAIQASVGLSSNTGYFSRTTPLARTAPSSAFLTILLSIIKSASPCEAVNAMLDDVEAESCIIRH